ncbi:MAG: response regulator [Synergistaceae bacterium]|nr:response regulator [Synergistaceae bacterium]
MMAGERKKIILVDDTPIVLKLARNTLMGKYDVFTAPSADKLFLLLNQVLPDLVLLDVLMPGLDGYETIKKLKGDPMTADIPVIFLTSKSDAGSEFEGLSLGAVDYIVKPFSPQLLLKRVDLHMLVETQRKDLEELNDNLQVLVEKKTASILELQRAVLMTMSNLVECRDDVTGEHVERTELYLRFLVAEMLERGLYAEQLGSWGMELFYQSALLHDVGKIAIRDIILLKPGKLTAAEFEEMKKHALFGEAIIEKIQSSSRENMFLTHARIMAGTHHERWDGKGYPRGLSVYDIPLQGRMMAIVDVYDALVSERPYKKAFSHEEAIRIIEEGAGSQFDPVLAPVFVDASARFAAGVVLHSA